MKKSKSENKIDWKESLHYNMRGMRSMFEQYPRLMTLRLLDIIFNSLSPYVTIYLSAMIVEELAGACRGQRLQELVLFTLAITAILTLIKSLIARFVEAENHAFWLYISWPLSAKMLQMDYIQVDSAEIQNEQSEIWQSLAGAGWGLTKVVRCVEGMLRAVLVLLGGLALTISLFTSPIPQASGWMKTLNQPFVVFGLLAALIITAIAAPSLSSRAQSFWAKHTNDHNMGNRLFGFYGFLGYKKERAMDVRMYEQEKVCHAMNDSKSYVFGSHGIFAKYFRKQGGALCALSTVVSGLFTGFVYIFVCLKAWGGAFGVGAVTQYVAAVTAMAKGLSDLIEQVGEMRNNAPFLKKSFDFLDIPSVMYKGSLTVEKRSDNRYEIEFRDVGFKYPGSDSWALRHVSTKFRVGEKMAVVGQNGSGKTTFIKLLCRLYDPTEGEILLNGIPIHKYNYAEYMDIFSVVFQDFKLLGLPLGENVAGRSQYDRSKVKRCLEKAGFADRLKTMPKGLDTTLYKDFDAEGIEVSGGEAQKIALARALYKDAPFIVLDEPTAALDPVAEYEIYTRFNDIVGDHTAIYISHRLSSCRFCDRIAVFDGGSIVQDGSHEQLLVDEAGKYAQLWNAQAQYYAEQGIEVGV